MGLVTKDIEVGKQYDIKVLFANSDVSRKNLKTTSVNILDNNGKENEIKLEPAYFVAGFKDYDGSFNKQFVLNGNSISGYNDDEFRFCLIGTIEDNILQLQYVSFDPYHRNEKSLEDYDGLPYEVGGLREKNRKTFDMEYPFPVDNKNEYSYAWNKNYHDIEIINMIKTFTITYENDL